MKIRNTQLAAALVALGFELLPTTDFTQDDVAFEFPDSEMVDKAQMDWQAYFKNDKRVGDDPLSIMFEVSKSRKWMLDRVVHGNHNQDIEEIPIESFPTTDLRLAICLVSAQCYLIKLDKPNKTFYFTAGAREWRGQYDNPTEGSQFDWGKKYLRALDDIVFRIHGRNSARQNVTKS